MPDITISPSCTTCNTIAAKTSRASPTCDDSRLHDLHHHRQVVNFGISTTIWERLFGTFEPTNEPATNYFFWSTIRSYWMKLTCKPSATS
jgi:sterol desaturase/sphingolipid hydroxylase (fatty acid hydroxylase superfamily)